MRVLSTVNWTLRRFGDAVNQTISKIQTSQHFPIHNTKPTFLIHVLFVNVQISELDSHYFL